MATLKQLKATAAKFNAELDGGKEGFGYDYNVEAPHGLRWKATGTHAIALAFDGKPADASGEIAAVIADMQCGLEPCGGCEGCE